MPLEDRPGTAPGAAGAPGGPTCFRHPGRETYLRCTRCDRPICTDCMITAAVGFQCPECVRGGSRTVRQARTAVGGRQHSRPGVVTTTLIVITFAVFGLQNLIGQAFTDRLDLQAMVPALSSLPTSTHIGVAYGDWYRLVTAIFVHENILHIGMNMVSLWIIGVPVESRLGRLRFLLTYLVCGIVGSAVSYLFLAPWGSSLGASGAIFGLLGVLAVLAYRERLSMQPIITTIVLNLVFSFSVPGIDWHDHLGGLGAGLLLGAAFAYAPRPRHVLGEQRPGAVVGWFRNPQNVIPLSVGILLLVGAALAVQVHTDTLLQTASTVLHLRGGGLNLP
jgi:membrane associated rhomboid family serine protease